MLFSLLTDNRTYWQNGSIAQDFVSGAISMQKLAEAMRLGKLGEQVVLKSRRAFSKLCYLGEEMVDAHIRHKELWEICLTMRQIHMKWIWMFFSDVSCIRRVVPVSDRESRLCSRENRL